MSLPPLAPPALGQRSGSRAFLVLGLVTSGVNLVWVTVLAISVLRLMDNALYLRSLGVIFGIAVLAMILRALRFARLSDLVIGLQLVISLALLFDGLDGVAY